MDPLAAQFDAFLAQGDLRASGVVFDALAPRLLPVAMHVTGHPADRSAERGEFVARLRQHVDALPAEQRQVLRLQLHHGLSPTQIAEALELPPGTVRMRLHRGLEVLRKRSAL